MKKGQINSTEDFIKWSASKSEMSGKPYLVKCGDGSPPLLAQWLSDELERYRRQNIAFRRIHSRYPPAPSFPSLR
jgi:hypothetical protein